MEEQTITVEEQKWSKEWPTDVGYYWFKEPGEWDSEACILEVAGCEKHGWVTYLGDEVLEKDEFLKRYPNCEYLGPITPDYDSLRARVSALEVANKDLRDAALTLSRTARPLSNFAFNVGQHREGWGRTRAEVIAFDKADNTVHSLIDRAALAALAEGESK